jgi:predicted  nucleic acid-binding Zn-ribbon protein
VACRTLVKIKEREKKMKDLMNRTNTIINKIKTIKKDKRRRFITPERNINPNKKDIPRNYKKIYQKCIRTLNRPPKIRLEKN